MKLILKKVHPAWNFLHDNEFQVGDEIDLSGETVTVKSGRKYHSDTLTRSFNLRCSIFDLAEKVEPTTANKPLRATFARTPDKGHLKGY